MLANKQFYISIVILLIATIGLFLGVMLPVTFRVRELRSEIDGEHMKIQERYQRRGQLKETILDLKEIEGGVGSLTSVAIREGKELEFIRALEDIATSHGVEQEIRLKTASQTEISNWELKVPITILAEGDYAHLLNYMRGIESLPYYIIIDSFNISSTRPSGALQLTDTPVKATMNGSVYWITDDLPAIIDPKTI